MKKSLLLLLLTLFIMGCSSIKRGKNGIRYFDENNIEISKRKFDRIRATNELLDIPGDSANHRKLTVREVHGEISNRPRLESLLEREINNKIDSTKPIVIIYYPGKDPCNSGGSPRSKERIKLIFDNLEIGLKQIAQTKPIYISKDYENMESYQGVLDWHKDPEGIIEKLFFKYHYPCLSFVVISKSGKFISYYGEFPTKYLWKAAELLVNE